MGKLREALRQWKHEWMCVAAPEKETAKYYRAVFGKDPDLVNPKTINEKIHYLKLGLYSDNETVTRCVDKVLVRDYLKERQLDDMLPGLLGVYDRPEDIDWDKLPQRFVIKCNHGCGYNIICKDKATLDTAEAEDKLRRWLKEDYWKQFCEPQYKHVKKKILIEEYLGDDIETYKFYCFNGEPRILYLMTTVGDNHYVDYLDMNWERMNVRRDGREGYPGIDTLDRPPHLEEMIELSRRLSADFPLVRVDLYDLDKVYFSELTFVPAGGFIKLDPPEAETEWGSWLSLDKEMNV